MQGESRANAKHRVASLRARAERQRDVSNLRHGQGQQPSGTYCCYSSATCMCNDVSVISGFLSESRCLQLSLIVTSYHVTVNVIVTLHASCGVV